MSAETFIINQMVALVRDMLRYPFRLSHFYKDKLVSSLCVRTCGAML